MQLLHESLKAIPPEQWGMLLAISFLGLLGVLATETIKD